MLGWLRCVLNFLLSMPLSESTSGDKHSETKLCLCRAHTTYTRHAVIHTCSFTLTEVRVQSLPGRRRIFRCCPLPPAHPAGLSTCRHDSAACRAWLGVGDTAELGLLAFGDEAAGVCMCYTAAATYRRSRDRRECRAARR